jgi:hypothetical protein
MFMPPIARHGTPYFREIRLVGIILLLSPAAGLGGEGAAIAPPFICGKFARSVIPGNLRGSLGA